MYNNTLYGILLLSLLSFSCAVIYVAPTGSGIADGSSINTPIGGLANATTYANSINDLNLVLLSGTYSSAQLTLYSRPGWNITSLYGSTSTIIDMESSNSAFVTFASSSETLSISKITIINSKYTLFRGIVGGASISVNNCVFKNITFGGNVGAIISATTNFNNVNFDSNTVSNCKTPTIYLTGGPLSITNNKFIQNSDVNGYYAITYKAGTLTSITISNNIFIENYGVLDALSASVTFTNNKIYSNVQTLACSAVTFASTSGTVFCGTNGNNISACAYSGDTKLTPFDGCKVCNGYNENKDCTGTCWGTTTSCSSPKKWYVSTSGTGNGTYTSPYGSIQAAINNASYGDSIVLFPGTYSVSSSLTFGNGITLTKDISGEVYNTIITTSNSIPVMTFQLNESYDTKISYITISGISSTNGAVYIQNASPTFDNVVFTGNNAISLAIRDNAFSNILNSQFLYSSISGAFSPIDIRFINAGTAAHIYIYGCRFESNSGSYGGVYQASDVGSLTLTKNIFKHLSGSVVNVLRNNTLNAYNNAFTNNTATVITCGTGTVNQSSNTFCGGNSMTCSNWGIINTSIPDGCGVCGGNNSNKDCNGTCFGYKTLDTSGSSCCLSSVKDCGGYCDSIFRIDKNSTCCNATLIDCDNLCYGLKVNDSNIPTQCCYRSEIDCENICYQGKINDTHGGCCFQNATDCAGYCNGSHKYDKTLPDPLCCYPNATDCGGYCNGTRKYDKTLPEPLCCFPNATDCGGYCDGTRKNDSLSNCCFKNETDCANVCNGTRIYDDYSTCCDPNLIDCSSTCNGTYVTDKYGQCCDPDVRDCMNECWGGRKNDSFGKCCYISSMDCSGECLGLKIKDTNGNCCLPTQLDCNNTCNGPSVYDNSYPLSQCCSSADLDCERICFGGKTNDTLGDCCDPNFIDCEGHCNGTKVWDVSNPQICCEKSNLDCAEYCNGNNKKDSNNMCCDASLIVCGICGGSTPCSSNTTASSSSSSQSSTSTSTSASTNDGTTNAGNTSSSGADGIGNGADQTKSASGASFGTRDILYVVFAVLWVLVIVAVITVVCIIRKRRN